MTGSSQEILFINMETLTDLILMAFDFIQIYAVIWQLLCTYKVFLVHYRHSCYEHHLLHA